MAPTETTLPARADIDRECCPRCGQDDAGREFYGPCARCRVELRNNAARPKRAEPAQENGVDGNRETAERVAAPLVTRRRNRRVTPRARCWLSIDDGTVWPPAVGDGVRGPGGVELGAVLGFARGRGVGIVHAVGSTAGEWVTAAAVSVAPAGWTPGRQHLHGVGSVARWVHDDGHQVVIVDAASWGAEGVTARQAAEGFALGVELIRDAGPRHLARWEPIGTPSAAGRDLLARVLPESADGWPVPAPELAELIRSTTGQGRAELIRPGVDVDELVELDMRLAYGAVAWGLRSGVPTWHRYAPPTSWDGGRLNGRYLVEWSAPEGWAWPGILSARTDDGIRWPLTGRGWADGCEVDLALSFGWTVHVVEGWTWPAGGADPMRRWASMLTDAAGAAEKAARVGQVSHQVARCARGVARSMLVAAIGALWGAPHRVTRTCPVELAGGPGGPPAGAPGVALRGDVVTWQELAPAAWPEMAHPEWAAHIWARTRCRLLSAPTAARGVKAGALHLDPERTIGFRTDCLYLAGPVPAWPDDGKAGRYRRKRSVPGPLRVPGDLVSLDRVLTHGAPPAVVSIGAARAALKGGGQR